MEKLNGKPFIDNRPLAIRFAHEKVLNFPPSSTIFNLVLLV